MESKPTRVVLIEDNEFFKKSLERTLADEGYEVIASYVTVDEALAKIDNEISPPPDVILTDNHTRIKNGPESKNYGTHLLKAYKDRGIGLVLMSQDHFSQEVISNICDHAIFWDKGALEDLYQALATASQYARDHESQRNAYMPAKASEPVMDEAMQALAQRYRIGTRRGVGTPGGNK